MPVLIPNAINDVLRLRNLTPCDEVNATMSKLVESVIFDHQTHIETMSTAVRDTVRRMSSDAETEMEKFWAKLVIDSVDPVQMLGTFPYIDNYTELTKLELDLVASAGLCTENINSILVVGSGPLPLSAYELNRQTGAVVDHVDSSLDAIELCQQISDALGVRSNYYLADGQSVRLEKKYDLILIAALAGSTLADKQSIINNILPSLHDSGKLILRSAKGNRELLYPAIQASALKSVELIKEYHPQDHIINSVFVYRKEK